MYFIKIYVNMTKKELLESKIEARFKTRCENAGGWCLKLFALSISGIPDRIVLMPGRRMYLVELKRIKNGKPTELSPVQKVVHKKLERLGFEVWRVYDDVSMDDFFKTITNNL